MKFDSTVKYKAGKLIPVVDTLSKVCFKAETDVSNAEADEHNAKTNVDKENHSITLKSCPIGINQHRKQQGNIST